MSELARWTRRLGATLALATPAIAHADVGGNLPVGQTIDENTAPAPLMRPRDFTKLVDGIPAGPTPGAAVSSNVIYLNNCKPNGCKVTFGNTDSTTDTSAIAQGTIAAFAADDATWASVVSCMKTVYAKFDVTITDTDPGTAPHFEIMIAGTSGDVGMASDIGGVADALCRSPGQCRSNYEPNALVFDFANEAFYTGNANEICATAAQEIAHAFTLDHVVDNTDPMTYNEGFSGIRFYHDNEICGSDCVSGKSPTGMTCTGTGGQATHPCLGLVSGTPATQNELQVITALFGAGTPTPPKVTITQPVANAYVTAGSPIHLNVTDDYGVSQVELQVDGASVLVEKTGPFAFNFPASLALGQHTADVIATDILGTTGDSKETVTVAPACTVPGDCPNTTDTCVGGHCEPGEGVQGGLGDTCGSASDCASGQCGNDGGGSMYCVDQCSPAGSDCPSGFDCLADGAADGTGVCWPAKSGGGCDADGHGGDLGTIGLGLGFAALLASRRRRL